MASAPSLALILMLVVEAQKSSNELTEAHSAHGKLVITFHPHSFPPS